MVDDRARLLARKARIEERLAQLAKADARKREDDHKRRTLLAGRVVLDHATRDEEFGRTLMGLLDQALTSHRDRSLFGFGLEEAGEATEKAVAHEESRSLDAGTSAAG